MKCPICKEGFFVDGKTTITVERGESILFFKNVAAKICNNCGEVFLSNNTSRLLFEKTKSAIENGAELEIIKLKDVA